ncbi:uncharacterized protein LOC131683588 [Topomyia yanbarensis]|uniref:uncharacterized protein LOC131683588 n=1 Tax=Topomyia yanbarensis TaxID=2498891 RepID=UPI00273B2CD9|nr:uncharacterized protein LOC131683588 [Topomyia yanbarensis]
MNITLNQTVLSLGTVLKTTVQPIIETAIIPGDRNSHSGNSESLSFLFIPLAVLITVMLLSVMVYLMARKKDRIFSKRPHVPSFSFDSSDLEDNDDLETEHLLKGKLRLDEPYFKGVNSCKTYTGSNELYA